MKKLVFSLALLAGITFYTSCSSDDNNDGGGNSNCVTCSITFEGGSNTKEICNIDGIAFDGDYNTEVSYDDYIAGQESVGYECN